MYAQGKEVEFDSQLSALQAVLSSIPEELFHEIELEVHNAEGAVTNKQRLQVLKEQQELIQEENEQVEEQKASGGAVTSVSDKENIDEKEEKEEEARQAAALSKDAAQDILESEGDLAQQQKLQAKQAEEKK
jgi:LETM1 and EF-hand domain-containing protein 1